MNSFSNHVVKIILYDILIYWIYSRGHFEINAQPLIFTYVIVIAILYTNFFGINTLLLKELYFEDDEYYMQYHAIWCIHSKGSVRGQKWASSTGNQRSSSDNGKNKQFLSVLTKSQWLFNLHGIFTCKIHVF